jgi:hypothetical protein
MNTKEEDFLIGMIDFIDEQHNRAKAQYVDRLMHIRSLRQSAEPMWIDKDKYVKLVSQLPRPNGRSSQELG